ncbi:hypothetical protein Sjap_005298 [Stephania japonica]|uniref:Uncharacterized protein n=1 Tax=Stephania japonica TaxID=461633 RepID=A0AAP0K679_9MAGN
MGCIYFDILRILDDMYRIYIWYGFHLGIMLIIYMINLYVVSKYSLRNLRLYDIKGNKVNS